MDPKDYHFYDIDEKQTEGMALIDHQHETHAPQTSNSFSALVAGAFAVFLLFVSLILGWIVFARHTGSSINLSHSIMCSLAFLFAAFATFFVFTLWRGNAPGISGNLNFAFLIYIGSILFAVYFTVAALYLWVQQQFFSHLIKCSNSVAADWQENFWGMNYENAQLDFWRIYLVLVLFSVLIAVCFALLANLAWNQMANKVQTKKITLGISLIAIVVFGFLVVICFLNNRATFHYIQSKLSAKLAYVPFIAFLFGIIALGIALLNALFNFLKVKTISIIFAFVWIAFFLVFAIAVALLFRNAYSLSKQSTFGRQEVANFIPENIYGEFCGSKYLDNNQNCGSAYKSVAWDRSPSVSIGLNPTCDCNSTDLILWPWYVFAILCAFLLASVGVAAVTNFALGSAEKDDNEYGSFHIFDIIALATIIALALGLGLYLVFRSAGVNNAFQQPGTSLVTSFKGALLPSSSFATVPQEISQNIQLKDQCYFLGKIALPIFQSGNTTNAGYSVGVLVSNGKINSNFIGSKAKLGPKVSRQHFFPNADNSNDDFINIYGNTDEVKDALRNLVVCQSALHINHGVYLNANKIDLAKIANNGLTGGVAPVYIEPYPTGKRGDLSGFVTPVAVCTNSCQYALVQPVHGYLNIRGTLLIKNANGQSVNYGVPEASLELNLYHNENGKEAFIAFGSYDANGNFLIQAPYIQNAGYKAVLHIDDSSNQYLSNTIDISVSPPNANSDLQVGNIYLTTVSGNGCKQADLVATNNCFAGLSSKNALLNLKLQDVINLGEDLEYPLTLTVRKSFSELGSLVTTQTLTGPSWSQVLPVGYYNLRISGNDYNDMVQTVTLDTNQTVTGYLERKVSSGYRIYAAIDNTLDPTSDYDLNLKIRAADGSECIVSPVNKICPYATHVQSISGNQKGFEVIDVPQFTNAYYMVYVTKNSAVVGNCPYTNTTAQRFLTPVDNHIVSLQTNSAVKVFTSNMGGSTFGKAGASTSSSYSPATTPVFNPIKYGDEKVIPNLFAALSVQNSTIPADKLFNAYVRSSDDASTFAASMPIIYSSNNIQAQSDLVTNQKNFPSNLVTSFNRNVNSGHGDQSSAQTYLTSQVFGLIATENSNQNQVIRQQNNLPATVNFYDVTGNNTIPNYMEPFGAIDNSVLSQAQAININNQNVVVEGPPQTIEEVVQTPVAINSTSVPAVSEITDNSTQINQSVVFVPTQSNATTNNQNTNNQTSPTVVLGPTDTSEPPAGPSNETIALIPNENNEQSRNPANETVVIIPSVNSEEPSNQTNETIVIVPINVNEQSSNQTNAANNTNIQEDLNPIVIPSTVQTNNTQSQSQSNVEQIIEETPEAPVNNQTQVENNIAGWNITNATDNSTDGASGVQSSPQNDVGLQIGASDLKVVEASPLDYSKAQLSDPDAYNKTILLNADGSYPLNTDLINQSLINNTVQSSAVIDTQAQSTPVQETPVQEQVTPVQEEPVLVQPSQPEEQPTPVSNDSLNQAEGVPIVVVAANNATNDNNSTTVEQPQPVQPVVEEPVESPQPAAVSIVDNSTVVEEPSNVLSPPQNATENVVIQNNSTAENTVSTESKQANTNSTENGSEAEGEVVPDRRLSRGRLLQALPATYQTQFCFTGFGQRSIKSLSQTGSGNPSIQGCVDLYPDSDAYSLVNLKAAQN